MRVQIMGRTEIGVPNSWAVLDENDQLVPQVNQYLRYLGSTEKPPNTQRAVAYDLRWYCEFLSETGRDFDDVSNELLALFARWYRDPATNVVAIVEEEAARKRSTTNRALATISGFYQFLGSFGEDAVGAPGLKRLKDSARSFERPRVSVVDNVGNANLHRTKTVLGPRLPRTKHRLDILTIQQVHSILSVCRDRKDKLIIMLAFSTGMRMGQILGLRHEDIDTRERSIHIEARVGNVNLSSSKKSSGVIPISEQINRLYIEYMHEEYGHIDSSYVFIDFKTLQPMKATAANSVVQRLKRRSGNDRWSLHTLRHTFVTLNRRAGVPIDVISHLVLHKSIQTTVDMYSHLDVEDLRRVLIESGAWEVAE